MRLTYLLLVIVAAASTCGGSSDNATESTTNDTTSSSSSSTGDVTSSEPRIPTTFCGENYQPCPQDTDDDHCVRSEGASICGAPCAEYGPGFAPGRCNLFPYADRSICPYNGEPGSSACLILCNDEVPCPEEGMVCVACPAAFEDACAAFTGYGMAGPDICAWPAP